MSIGVLRSAENWITTFRPKLGAGLLIAFVFGVAVRIIPELLSYPHPIGFDTIHYAARMVSGVVWQHWSAVVSSTWLFYALIVPTYEVLRIDPFLLLKVVAPMLYGLNVAGVFYLARKGLGWNIRKSLFAGGFFAFQLGALRISWDLLRNTLGMGILLFAFPLSSRLESKYEFVGFIALSLLTVFAHEFVAVTLLFIMLWMVLRSFLKDNLDKQSRVRTRLIFASLPAFATFLVSMFLRMGPIRYAVETNIVNAGDTVGSSFGSFFFFVNYLLVKDTVQNYQSYFDLALNVLVLFAVLFLPYLYLIRKGFFREVRLDAWTSLLLVGAFGCLIAPFFALNYWSRWMLMLVYPFTFYAVNGIERMLDWRGVRMFSFEGLKKLSNYVKAMILVTVLLGSLYLATPVLMENLGGGVASIPPIGAYFSSAPTVPYQDVEGVIQAMEWLDTNIEVNACLVLQHAFVQWGILYLGESHKIIEFSLDGSKALDAASENGYRFAYSVWWNEDIGWYEFVKFPSDFSVLRDFGRISVLMYNW